MHTYIALLRGINVGGKHLLPMKDLVVILEAMAFENIRTYIQSGNVVFQSKKHIRKDKTAEIGLSIGRAILQQKGFEPKVLLLSKDELADAIRHNPFSTYDGKVLHFFFLETQPSQPNLAHLESLKLESENFVLEKRVLYIFAPDGLGRSKLAAAVEKSMAVPVTARNCNTVSKLMAMAEK